MENNLPLKIINKELEVRKCIVLREFLHLVLIWRHFCTYNSKEASGIREGFSALETLVKDMWGKLKKLGEKEIETDNPSDFFNRFEEISKVNEELEKILEQIDFLQKKISYTLEAFPSYYPSPNIFRARQELKTYEILEKIAEDYLSWLCKNLFGITDKNFETHVYWEANVINKFLPPQKEKEKIQFFFNGSYYMVNQPSLWIILAHEALHFLMEWTKKNEKYRRKSFFKDFGEIRKSFSEDIKILEDKTNASIGIKFVNIVFDDAICDSILTHISGLPYFVAIWKLVFGFDEEDSHYYTTRWWIRLKSSVKILKEENKKDGRARQFDEVLDQFHRALEEKGIGEDLGERCLIEEKISSIISKYTSSIIKKYKNELRSIRKEAEEKYLWVDKALLERFSDINDNELHEGRIYSLAHKDNFNRDKISFWEEKELEKLGLEYTKNSKEYIEHIKKVIKTGDDKVNEIYAKTQLFLLRFLKIRFDGYGDKRKEAIRLVKNCLHLDKNNTLSQSNKYNNCFLHLGSFFMAYIDPNFWDKKLNFENKQAIHAIEHIIDEKSKENQENKEDDENKILWDSMEYDCLFYKEDIVAGMIYLLKDNEVSCLQAEEEKNKIKKFFEECRESVLMVIQIKFKKNSKNKQQKDKQILKFANDLCNKVEGEYKEILIGYTASWADWVLITKLKDSKDYTESIRSIKEFLHENPQLQRTKSDILIGQELLKNNITLPAPEIVIRVSGEFKGNKCETLKELENKGWKHYMRPGIYDVILFYKNKEISLQELLKETIKPLVGNTDTAGKKYPFLSDIQFRFNLQCDNEKNED